MAMSAAALVWFPVSARAGANLDRDDLVDIDWFPYCDSHDGCESNFMRAFDTEYETSDSSYEGGLDGAYGAVNFFYDSPDHFANLWWFLYEPDFVQRNGQQAQQEQKDWLGLLLSYYVSIDSNNSFYSRSYRLNNAEAIQGCNAKVNVTHMGDDAKWSASCKAKLSDLLSELGAGPQVLTDIEDVIGKQINKKFSISGSGPIAEP
jgi:hypothetical protein